MPILTLKKSSASRKKSCNVPHNSPFLHPTLIATLNRSLKSAPSCGNALQHPINSNLATYQSSSHTLYLYISICTIMISNFIPCCFPTRSAIAADTYSHNSHHRCSYSLLNSLLYIGTLIQRGSLKFKFTECVRKQTETLEKSILLPWDIIERERKKLRCGTFAFDGDDDDSPSEEPNRHFAWTNTIG